jgi:hypothetical protein
MASKKNIKGLSQLMEMVKTNKRLAMGIAKQIPVEKLNYQFLIGIIKKIGRLSMFVTWPWELAFKFRQKNSITSFDEMQKSRITHRFREPDLGIVIEKFFSDEKLDYQILVEMQGSNKLHRSQPGSGISLESPVEKPRLPNPGSKCKGRTTPMFAT